MHPLNVIVNFLKKVLVAAVIGRVYHDRLMHLFFRLFCFWFGHLFWSLQEVMADLGTTAYFVFGVQLLVGNRHRVDSVKLQIIVYHWKILFRLFRYLKVLFFFCFDLNLYFLKSSTWQSVTNSVSCRTRVFVTNGECRNRKIFYLFVDAYASDRLGFELVLPIWMAIQTVSLLEFVEVKCNSR